MTIPKKKNPVGTFTCTNHAAIILLQTFIVQNEIGEINVKEQKNGKAC